MPSNKDWLYVVLYPSGVVGNEEQRYHWAFLIGPKVEKVAQVPGKRYHVKNIPNPLGPGSILQYEEMELQNVQNTTSLLIRVMIGKIKDLARFIDVFRSVPVIQNDPDWRCRTWCANMLSAIASDGRATGTLVLDWQRIEQVARWYAEQKTAEGRFADSALLERPKPTWNLLENQEMIL